MDEKADIPLKLLDGTELPGFEPIVVLGPNGSGKTRYARKLAATNGADFIAALRNIQLNTSIPMQALTDATANLQQLLITTQSNPWLLSSEIDTLFSKLMAEDSAAAVEFRDDYNRAAPTAKPSVTKLMRLNTMWSAVFPGRTLTFAGYAPKVTSNYAQGAPTYAAQQMSDGERVALYLSGRVLDSTSRFIFVDEPEVHFHSRLATRFWDELEQLRPDCRFVYITHDLPFALSRATNRFLVVRKENSAEIITLESNVPDDIAQSILAAATISIYAKRIVFCEGSESSLDQQFFAAWFNDKDTAVVPVGSCRDVLRCTVTFRDKNLVAGVTAEGLVDSDYWPADFLSQLPGGVSVLPVHEIESLFCLKSVFCAIAEHCGRSTKDAEEYYSQFIIDARSKFVGGFLAKQISERFRARCEQQVRNAMNNLHVDTEVSVTRTSHCEAVASDKWMVKPDQIFDEEQATLEKALNSDAGEILRFFPGKTILSNLATKLGMTTDTYSRMIFDALRAPSTSKLHSLGETLSKNLQAILPKRA